MSLYPFALHANLVDHSEELCVGVCPKMAHHHVSEFVARIVNVDGHGSSPQLLRCSFDPVRMAHAFRRRRRSRATVSNTIDHPGFGGSPTPVRSGPAKQG
ncbi:hypothetical protein AGR7A_Lc120537 [Agrobacterium deltaense NCPPB 1641]|uniref:Uncharacterized protein n=1 Tax=Agrobacterium deltaense NCPPB 1641 TaxID=1183425 RepID=A0A1S7TXY6_9HYPH|nr:hypothetical protein AGR7A_Lc120537 [Agrobacterium deltaense NCPPB 1641]